MSRLPRCSLCGIQPKNLRDIAILPTPMLDQLSNSNSPAASGVELLVKNQLTHIRDKMKTLEEAIENLQKARCLLEQEEANLARIISPVRRVPPEILSEIFIIYAENWWLRLGEQQLRGALPQNEYVGWDRFSDSTWGGWIDEVTRAGNPDRDLTDPTLQPTSVLPQVCHSWRAAACGCSTLWADICFYKDYDHPTVQRILKKQLQLSSNRPLRVHTPHRFSSKEIFPFFRDILPTSHRWTSISTLVDGLTHPVFPGPDISPSFPSLVSLTIILDDTWRLGEPDDPESDYKIAAADAPLLREVALAWPDHTSAKFDLPWSQLHKLQYWRNDGEELASIIGCLQEVIELDILGVSDYGESLNGLPLRSLHLPSLRCLRLSNVGCNNFRVTGKILPYMDTPALQTLYWTKMNGDDINHLQDMFCGEGEDSEQRALENLHLYNPERDVFEPSFCSHVWRRLVQTIGPRFQSLKIEYPTSSGVNVTQVVEPLVTYLYRGELPHFHHLLLQGVHIDCAYLEMLVRRIETHECDIRLRNCTLNTQEEFEGAYMFEPPKPMPDGTYLELDVEAPNRKRLVYTMEDGTKLEESCRCRLEGSSLQKGRRSNVFRVV